MEVPRPPSGRSLKEALALKQLLGTSEKFVSEIRKIGVVAPTEVPVLVTGETGTGKELCARAIHYLSKRSSGPFVPVNCGAIPVTLIENEIFGHETGAYTGADSRQTGLIEEAEGGTIFLDEIDSLIPVAQAKLLRFLQEGEARRLGSGRSHKVNVRVVAAMNGDAGGHALRDDLYFRLSIVQLDLPPLRERLEDIPILVNHFLRKWSQSFERTSAQISLHGMKKLATHPWPGNVRELENTIARAVLFSESEVIEASQITFLNVGKARKLSSSTVSNDRGILEKLLLTHHGNISHAAHATGRNRRTIQRLIEKYEIDLHELRHH